MTGTTLHIPTIETERLILRAPRMEDTDGFSDLYASDRSRFIGGPNADRKATARAFGHVAGLWILRGVSSFVADIKGGDRAIGSFGPWHPFHWPELEFGWTLWSEKHEGNGYVTEALRAIIPWTWKQVATDTAISIIDVGNDASERVAKALGATLDVETTERLNRPGAVFHDPERPCRIFRHTRGALT